MPPVRKQEPVDASNEWVSLTEAARLLGSHRETVLQLAIKGTLKVEHRGNYTFVSRASIDAYLAAADVAAAE
jgi:excisionase family DNA binding protein